MVVNSSRAQVFKMLFCKEGIMARIRVNTEDLKTKAKDFDSAAEALNRAGDDILAAAMAMPSYDGQLSGPARKAGYEIQSQARELKAALSNNAEFLRKAAQDFEDVDNRTVDLLAQNQDLLASTSPAELRGIDVGDSYLGYRDDGLSDTVILCMYGTCREVVRAGNEEIIAEFEKNADEYEKQKEIMLNEFYKVCLAALTASGALIALSIATAGLATVIAALAAIGSLGGEALEVKAVQDAEAKMEEATFGAAYYWNKLIGETGLGPCVTGDENQSPIDIWTRDAGDIYDP
ncbi:MAG: type VII secretion target [Anaerolineales bacterium]